MNIKQTILITGAIAVLGVCAYFACRPSLDEMVGQMIMTGFHGDGAGANAADFAAIMGQVKKGQVGGVILFDVDVSGLIAQGFSAAEAKKQIFSSNIKDLNQVRELTRQLQAAAPTKLLIAIDQEGGRVQRLKPEHGFASTPSAAEIGRGVPKNTFDIAYNLGTRLAELGINVDFAPVLDVNVNSVSPAIGAMDRSFSSDPDTVAEHGAAFGLGLGAAGIGYSFKHFPGHGSAGTDSHLGLTDVSKTYQQYEITPWRRLVAKASPLAMVMVAHLVNKNIDDLPASLSKRTIDMLRAMGFDGVVVSDDMDMGAITNEYGRTAAIKMAIDAGNDILVFGNNLSFDPNRGAQVHAAIVNMVKSGQISRARIRDSYRRIMRLKAYVR